MFNLSDIHYHRKCYLETDQVPTQTVIKKTMTPALAKVYFKSMSPQLKVLAGLRPPMKGGGLDWYMPPEDLLQGRAVLKPVKKEHLNKLGCNGINYFEDKIVAVRNRVLDEETLKVLLKINNDWKNTIHKSTRDQMEDTSKEEARKNTQKIQDAFAEFSTEFVTSITNVEALLMDAAIQELKRVHDGLHKESQEDFATRLKQQATIHYDKYTEKLAEVKAQLKSNFLKNIITARKCVSSELHDINVEKHLAVEKLRHLLECQNLACQIYVALKEREACEKEIELSTHKHKKKAKVLKERLAMQEFEFRLEVEKERKRQELNEIWKTKICHVVKKFQIFVEYSLQTLPEYADFFINMEKLMLLQLSDALETPSVNSIFETHFHTPPVPKPHPFYLFCDTGYKPQPDQNLCPKHCTSSASQLPVIVVNKRCIYAACDNFDEYTDKATQYINGRRGDDADFEDLHKYQFDVPVTFTSSQQLLELKLESSLMQVLQQELPNIRELSLECGICKIPYCFCSPMQNHSITSLPKQEIRRTPSLDLIPSETKLISRREELKHEREPKWESYLDYLQPKKCKCAKAIKKNLREHMPPYMKNMSKFEQPELPNYELCSVITLKKLVKEAKGKHTPPPEPETASKNTDVGTQCEDHEFERICKCFSDLQTEKLFDTGILKDYKMFDAVKTEAKFEIVDGSISPTYLSATASTFATKRAFSLRQLLDDEPVMEEIFKKKDCKYD